jgi:ATP-dependent Clp protease protease subunit
LAGAKGKRYALPQARILLHQPHGTAEGQAVDIEIQAKEFVRNRELMNGIIAEHTGQLIERVSRDTDRDFILTAEQAVEYGAVDEVITSRKIRPLLAAAPAEGS